MLARGWANLFWLENHGKDVFVKNLKKISRLFPLLFAMLRAAPSLMALSVGARLNGTDAKAGDRAPNADARRKLHI